MGMDHIQPIPTRYRTVTFRSRLEARWAAFFDLVSWDWEYTNPNPTHHIPDFILNFHFPILVEVRPITSFSEASLHGGIVYGGGWRGEMLVVGSSPHLLGCPNSPCGLIIGALGDMRTWEKDLRPAQPDWDAGIMSYSAIGKPHYALRHSSQSWHCRVCGGTHWRDDEGLESQLRQMWDDTERLMS